MFTTTTQLVCAVLAMFLGVVPAVVALAFVFRKDFRRDILRLISRIWGQHPAPVALADETPQIELSWSGLRLVAKGIVLGLTGAYVLLWIVLFVTLLSDQSPFDSAEDREVAQAKAKEANARLAQAESDAKNLKAQIEDAKGAAFYIGQYARFPFGTHFGCGTAADLAAKQVCAGGQALDVSAIASHGGNRCGYTYFAVVCSSKSRTF